MQYTLTSEDFEQKKENNLRNRRKTRNLQIKHKAAEKRSTIEEIRQVFVLVGSYIINMLDEILALIAEYFLQLTPSGKIWISHSILHKKQCYIIESTIYKTIKPVVKRKLHYNGHYKVQGRKT